MSPTPDFQPPTRQEAARARAIVVMLGVVVMTLVIGCLAFFTVRGLGGNLAANPFLVCEGVALDDAPAYENTAGIHPVLAYRALPVEENVGWTIDSNAVPEIWLPDTPEAVELVLCIDEAEPLTLPDCADATADVPYGSALSMRLLAARDGTEVAATTLTSAPPPDAACLDAAAPEPDPVAPERIWNWVTPYVVVPE